VRSYRHAPIAEVLTPPAYPLDFALLGAIFALLALAAASARPRKYLAAFLVARDMCGRSEKLSNVTLEIGDPLRRWGSTARAETLDCAALTR
jgi:hypothetical protein